ncbi:MAG: sugar transferase [Phenylobacterium sp.]|uniref:sugar transferase n=1 Tax=Phenylobacterium sp. TaxID=1871053 RepID=UPI002735E62D|nr:sugar transferase [Phenylobacterium sp.]MDP3176043.1 sugar transferase [Phenylobacterium sp.]
MTELTFAADVTSAPRSRSRRMTSGDMANALLALVVLLFVAPMMIAIALSIRAQDGGPALFRQRRVGRDGRVFECLKFRTMVVDSETMLAQRLAADPLAREEWTRIRKLRDDPRVTPAGRFLRRASLDELPQLINILRGDMGLVGPRPIMEEEIALYGVHLRHYCAVRPGMTGLWQVSGRNQLSFRRRVVMDVAYVRRRRLALDLKILARTLPVVFLQRGSS